MSSFDKVVTQLSLSGIIMVYFFIFLLLIHLFLVFKMGFSWIKYSYILNISSNLTISAF